MINLRNCFRKRVVKPALAMLKHDVSPDRIAFAMAIGTVVGIFPVIGTTTVLGTAAAIALRLNLPAVQLINFVVYPLQIALLIPFFHAGAWIFGADPLALSTAELASMFENGIWNTIVRLWETMLRAIVAWILISVPAAAGLYVALKSILKYVK